MEIVKYFVFLLKLLVLPILGLIHLLTLITLCYDENEIIREIDKNNKKYENWLWKDFS